MDLQAVLRLFDRDERQEIDFPGMTREAFPHLIRFVRPAPGASYILYTDLDEANAVDVDDVDVDDVIEEQVAHFTRLGRPFSWKVFSHDRPADLVERLVARGFVADETDAVMVLDVAHAPDSLLAVDTANVRRLDSPSQLDQVVAVLKSVWDQDFTWVYERLGSHMEIPGYLSVFVAYVDDNPAAAGWTYYNKGSFAGLWGGSTVAEYRGRGLYTALLAARVREARLRGVPWLTVDAGSMSRPIVARHGFETITWATDCNWEIPAEDGRS